ncbi:MAG: Transposase DDE domain-containing protein, partial [Candidatus Kentron sp. G]
MPTLIFGLQDLGPNPAPGNKPIVVGHSYSVTALLLERESESSPFVAPLTCTRIPTDRTAKEIAAEQVGKLLSDKKLPFHGELTVHVADSGYGNARYLSPMGVYENGVAVVRIISTRKLHRDISGTVEHVGAGRPKCFGEVFRLNDESTWWEPDEEVCFEIVTKKGKRLWVKLRRWNDLLMRGKKDAPMYNRPFDLICCQVLNEDGTLAFKNALWLTISGKRRREISSRDAYEAYRQRYDIEHFFRFGKNKLLLDDSQTCELEHEESWWEL